MSWRPEVSPALSRAARGGRGTGSGPVVYPARSRRPYGRSTHGGSELTHVVDGVFIAWRRGRMIGSIARWRCRNRTEQFALLAEPVGDMCMACASLTIGRRRTGAILEPRLPFRFFEVVDR